VAGGTMLCLWRRMGEEDRGRLWRLYGWFTGLMTCGSCFGAVTWTARMMFLVNDFKAHDSGTISDKFQHTTISALALSWLPTYLLTYAIEFLCLCAAKLMVLDRMLVFAAPQDASLQKRWALAGRVVMAAAVLGNAAGLAANAAAAVHFQKASEADRAASVYYAANNTKDGDSFDLLSVEERQRAGFILSAQRFAEVAVLLLIIVAFAVVGVLCARILNTRLKPIGLDAGYDAFMSTVGRTLRRHMLGTTAFIFITFLLRSVFSSVNAVALAMRDVGKDCPGVTSNCDASCYNEYTHCSQWMDYTPEFQLTVILISSPVAQLVALWGMTTKSMLHLMKSSRRDNALTLTLVQRKKAEEEEPSMG
jgi:hypothetical protein